MRLNKSKLSQDSEQFCDKLRRQVGATKTASFQVVRSKQVEACEGNFRQVPNGLVLEQKRTCGTSGEGIL